MGETRKIIELWGKEIMLEETCVKEERVYITAYVMSTQAQMQLSMDFFKASVEKAKLENFLWMKL